MPWLFHHRLLGLFYPLAAISIHFRDPVLRRNNFDLLCFFWEKANLNIFKRRQVELQIYFIAQITEKRIEFFVFLIDKF